MRVVVIEETGAACGELGAPELRPAPSSCGRGRLLPTPEENAHTQDEPASHFVHPALSRRLAHWGWRSAAGAGWESRTGVMVKGPARRAGENVGL